MYFNSNRYNLLKIEDNFAHLNRVNEKGDFEFSFYYSVSQREAITREALNVNVTVLTKIITKKPLVKNTPDGSVDTKKLIRNVLSQVPDVKNLAKQQQSLIVAQKNSDITSQINNELIGQLRSTAPVTKLMKSSLQLIPTTNLKTNNVIVPVLSVMGHNSLVNVQQVQSASISENTTSLMYDMITRQGVDPSSVTTLTHRSIPASSAKAGLLRSSRAPEVEASPITRLFNHYVFPTSTHDSAKTTTNLTDTSLVQVLVSEIQYNAEILVNIIIPKRAFFIDGNENYNVFVKFELIDSKTKASIDTVVKPLDVAKHLQILHTPLLAPSVTIGKSDIASRVNLDITQKDDTATSVAIYKKTLYRSIVGSDDYTLINTYDLKKSDQSLLVAVDQPYNSTTLYRVVPLGPHKTLGFEYTNVVVNAKKYNPIKSISLTTMIVDTGISVEIRNIPQSVVAIELKVKNLSLYEQEYSAALDNIILINDQIRNANLLSVIHANVNPNHIYDYVAKLIFKTGTSELSDNAIVEFHKPTPDKIDTKISNVFVDNTSSELNVTFDITTTILDTHIDVIKKLLENKNVEEFFKNDIALEREYISNLVAHNVQRVNLTTGEREDFGVLTTTFFSDSDLRKNQAIKPLNVNHHYRYEILALLRSPETTFDSLVKEKTDVVTKKTYSYNPLKFLHPITLTRGILVSSSGLKFKYAKDQMTHGVIGNIKSTDITFENDVARIVDASSYRFDKFTNVLNWKLQGSIDQIDHFIIMKDCNGIRTIIGKTHSEFIYGNCQYVHPITTKDQGAYTYVITPVFNDYKMGASVVTNLVINEVTTMSSERNMK